MRSFAVGLIALIAAGCQSDARKATVAPDKRALQVSLPPAAESLLAAGHAQYKEQEFEAARHLWLALLPRAHAARDSSLEAELYTWLGLAAYRLGNLDSARAWETRALRIKSRLASPHELWRSYNALGLIALDENLNDSAAVLFEKAGAVANDSGDPAGVAKATGNAALAYSYLGDLRRARAGHRSMRAAGKNLSDGKVEANGLANEAMVDIWEGDAASGISRLDTARGIYRKTRDAVGEANALGQLATAYELTGDFNASFASLDSALTLTRKHGLAANTIEILRLLGSLHSRLGDHRRSVGFFDEAEKLARSSGADSDLASILRGAAGASFRLGNLRRGKAQAEEALRLHGDAEEPLDEVDDLLMLAEIDEAVGRKADAAGRLTAATARAGVTGNATAQAAVLVARARMADRAGEPLRTLTLLRQLSPDSLRIGFELRSTAAALASRAFLRLGALDSAIASGGRAVESVERVRAGLAATAVRSAYISDRSQVYSDYIVALLRAGKIEEAFAVADRARSRALLENLGVVREGAKGAGIPRELVESERVLRRIDALMDALARTSPPRSDARGRVVADAAQPIVARLATARAEYERLQIRVAARKGASTAVLNGSPLELGQLRGTLDPDEAVLEYFLGVDSLFAFVVRRGGLRVARTAVDPHVIAQRLRLLKDLWGSPRDDWSVGLGVSRALHEDLIAPARRAGLLRGVRRIVIVPHGVLAQVPYAGLQDPRSRRFLIQDYDLGESPSAAALIALRLRAPAVGGSRRGAALAPFGRELPGTAREVAVIAAMNRATVVRTNERATEAELRRELGGGGVVHVASHGVLNHLNPMFSRIELARIELARGSAVAANNGRLEVHELLGLDIRSPLVFLSGCETGASEEWTDGAIRTTGDLTLSQAFLSAGALNVASTLWRIDDDGAAEIAGRFYSAARRMPVFDALSSAQRSLAREPRFANPYYWAGYVMTGEGRRIDGPQKTSIASVK